MEYTYRISYSGIYIQGFIQWNIHTGFHTDYRSPVLFHPILHSISPPPPPPPPIPLNLVSIVIHSNRSKFTVCCNFNKVSPYIFSISRVVKLESSSESACSRNLLCRGGFLGGVSSCISVQIGEAMLPGFSVHASVKNKITRKVF